MAEQSLLKVQLKQRRATASYWDNHKTEVIPGAGEIVVYLPDDTQSDISFKIGDGTHDLANLPMFVKVSGGPKGDKGDKGDTGADGAAGTPGTNGYTFTPAVSSAGVISWTNNGGLTNPTSVNIKGPKGDKGDKGDDGTGVSIKSSQSECTAIGDAYIGSDGHIYILSTLPSTFTDGGEIKGPKGDKGDTGSKGDTGAQGPAGEQGPKGDQGAKGDTGETGATGDGISTITKTSTSGLVDTYTITFTSGEKTTFTVTNGSDATVEWSSF